jgi:hypothetical protein
VPIRPLPLLSPLHPAPSTAAPPPASPATARATTPGSNTPLANEQCQFVGVNQALLHRALLDLRIPSARLVHVEQPCLNQATKERFIARMQKGLSFISNRQRRKEGTFSASASELAEIEPTPAHSRRAGYARKNAVYGAGRRCDRPRPRRTCVASDEHYNGPKMDAADMFTAAWANGAAGNLKITVAGPSYQGGDCHGLAWRGHCLAPGCCWCTIRCWQRLGLFCKALVLTCGLSSGFRVVISSYQSFWAA